MNYIVIIAKYGLSSMRETINQMSQQVTLLARKENGTWISNVRDRSFMLRGQPIFTPNDKVISWGNSMPVGNAGIHYNTGKAVSISSDKGLFRKVMMENEIPIPTPYHKDTNRWPIVIRPLHHHAGKHFFVANNITEFSRITSRLGEYYASEVYPKQREIRVHCASGKVLLIKEKPAPADKNTIAWNFAINEEAWTTIDRQNYDPELCKIALQAMDAISLDIGAVDVMFDPSEKGYAKYVICEINTAPSLTPYLQQKYAMYFDHIFRANSKLNPWNWSKFTKGKSFSWKNEQLEN